MHSRPAFGMFVSTKGGYLKRTLLIALACAAALSPLRAGDVPEIPFDSVPNVLKLPPDMYLGEVSGVAVNLKKQFSSTTAATRLDRRTAPRVVCCPRGNFVPRNRHTALDSRDAFGDEFGATATPWRCTPVQSWLPRL